MYPRARILRAEERVSNALKERAERRKQWLQGLPSQARPHAAAVAAIVLAGEPKIDEPLIRAWTRALQHYEISVKDPTQRSEQVNAAHQLFPIIVGQEKSDARFAEIFKSAPDWLLQFTRMSRDAWVLEFPLPGMKAKLGWGIAGFEDAERYPCLPLGVLTAGDPIPPDDERHITLTFLAIGRPSGMPRIRDLSSVEETLPVKKA
jgi:hypothetical protein